MEGILIVQNLFNGKDLVLKTEEATINILSESINIKISFPEVYSSEDCTWDSQGNEILDAPFDFVFKDTPSLLELEIPVTDKNEMIFNKQIVLDDDDELTNFYIAQNHYSTFNNEIFIHRKDSEFKIIWKGLLPDIKYWDFDKAMSNEFAFVLETDMKLIK